MSQQGFWQWEPVLRLACLCYSCLLKLPAELSAIIAPFPHSTILMEAEQLNALTHQLQDLRVRITELRRYL